MLWQTVEEVLVRIVPLSRHLKGLPELESLLLARQVGVEFPRGQTEQLLVLVLEPAEPVLQLGIQSLAEE